MKIRIKRLLCRFQNTNGTVELEKKNKERKALRKRKKKQRKKQLQKRANLAANVFTQDTIFQLCS